MTRGSRDFEYDFDSFKIGTADHAEGATGCTAFRFRESLIGAVDVRGGAAAISDPHSVSLENTWGMADGLMFAGGSTYGLAAAEGAKASILRERKSSEFTSIPSIPAAIVYDFRGRSDLHYPDVALGQKAWDSAQANRVRVGASGAGRNVSVGKIVGEPEPSGQGAAYHFQGGVKLFALSVVNAAGCILDRSGQVIAGNVVNSQRLPSAMDSRGNTTISVLITNARLDRIQLNRLCVSAHAGLGRVIDPYATGSDGDVFFAFTTAEVDLGFSHSALAALGSRLAQDAVISAIHSVAESSP